MEFSEFSDKKFMIIFGATKTGFYVIYIICASDGARISPRWGHQLQMWM